jgi:polyisoprenoid-binding protein YceI
MIRILFSVLIAVSASIAQAAVAPAGSYQIDPAHTNVGFEVVHLGIGSVVGRFNRFQGTIQFQPGGDSRVAIDIEVASIDTNVGQRDNHLRSADFFDAAQFPVMRFESTKVDYNAEGAPIAVQGNLSFHGVTQPVTLTVTPLGAGAGPLGETRAGFKATATIKRTAFGMNKLLAIAGDDVTINLNVEGIQQ